ncbi:LB_289 family protein [Leptospira alexanderi]|uniref:Uncharacterized protein n=1 Tax=Leptospira alexanderi serovar Manhao 3 str. L 60 TaxID=1049759 RepID=V6I9B2_9LEPT|nr:hypothetical protein [Leptospira alexanderi]EQA64129.1 hypothetical protein LEP1GSC062_4367 [Leptospira alexanderi serovar Manhao 3 str. L 60]
MKRTELERRERDLRKAEKKVQLQEKRLASGKGNSVGVYIDELSALFRYDATEIFNTGDDIAILELLEDIQANLPAKQWENVLRKAIKKTGVQEKEKAYNELKELMNEEEPEQTEEEIGA